MFPRRYCVNDSFFVEAGVDQGYILGYAYGDGCVNENDGQLKQVTLYGALGDEELLEQMVGRMGSDYPVRRQRDHCRVSFNSSQLAEDMVRLGFRGRVPVLDGRGKVNFIRGLLDSDGGIYRDLRGLQVQFGSTTGSLMKETEELLRPLVGVEVKVFACSPPGNRKVFYRFQYRGRSAEKVLNVLRPEGSELFLGRKWNEFTGV